MEHAPIFSADSHTMEPADLWEQRLDRKWRDRAPRVIKNHQGKKGSVFVAEGLTPFPVGGGFAAGTIGGTRGRTAHAVCQQS